MDSLAIATDSVSAALGTVSSAPPPPQHQAQPQPQPEVVQQTSTVSEYA